MTEIIPISSVNAIQRACQVIKAGGLVAFPTDTVYGLGADLYNSAAIDKIYQAKDRDMSKAIAVLVGDIDQVIMVTEGFSPPAQRLAGRYWPGALTLVVARKPGLPENLSMLPTIGIRMPDHSFALKFLKTCGPLATTSANLSGGPNTSTAEEVLAQLENRVDLILDGGKCPGGVPSSVVDCTTPDIRILRTGAIPDADILSMFPNEQ